VRGFKILSLFASLLLLVLLFQNFDFVPNLKRYVELPLGLKARDIRLPANETLDPAMIEVGNLLFFDQRLSKNGQMSCATCHIPSRGYSTVGMSKGVDGNTLIRTAPSAANRLFSSENNWLGQHTLEGQSTAPILAAEEMGLTSAQVIALLSSIPGYVDRFERLVSAGKLASPAISMKNISLVMASFQRSLMSANSRVDQYEAGITTALSADEIAGRNLFRGKANCIICHSGSNYSNESYHNIVSGCPVGTGSCLKPIAGQPESGRYLVTGNLLDVGKFKTPSLRNVGLRGPFFHRGIDSTLKIVVRGYNVAANLDNVIGQDPILIPLGLTDQEENQIVAFLMALNSETPSLNSLSSAGTPTSAASREHILLSPQIFNLAYYRSRYTDLAGKTDEQVRDHWINVGLPAGRQANLVFIASEYLQLYADIGTRFVSSTKFTDAALHYLTYGLAEGRGGRFAIAPQFFKVGDYRNLNGAAGISFLSSEKATEHYLTTGLGFQLSTHSQPKGYFKVSTNYYYSDGKFYCKFTTEDDFKRTFRSDGLGFPRLSYIPPNIMSVSTPCTVGLGEPIVERFLAGETYSTAKLPFKLTGDVAASSEKYASLTEPKAMALADNGTGFVMSSPTGLIMSIAEAERMALEGCQVVSGDSACTILASGSTFKFKYSDFLKSDRKVLVKGARSFEPATTPWQRDAVKTNQLVTYLNSTVAMKVLALGYSGAGVHVNLANSLAENRRVARERCEGYFKGKPCTIYAEGNTVVFNVTTMNYNFAPVLNFQNDAFSASKVPFVTDAARTKLNDYVNYANYYSTAALAIHPNGAWAYNNSPSMALSICKTSAKTTTDCVIYAQGLKVTWNISHLQRSF
jgi:cytochrome c peroxidase